MSGPTLGLNAQLVFGAFGNKSVDGKVDTGATVSSLHAVEIKMDKGRNVVSFVCPPLSDKVITLQLDGSQEVHSADAGGVTRPVVTLDVEIDGTLIKGATFNLNDRSGMDSAVLIGQNILKAGNFQIDSSAEGGVKQMSDTQPSSDESSDSVREQLIIQAIETLVENNVSLPEIVVYLRTVAVNTLKD